MPEIRAVVTDLNNTLLHDVDGHDVIPDSVLEALRLAESLGVRILPATGMSLSLLGDIQPAVSFSHSAVLDGGASVYDLSTGTYVSKRWLSEEKVKEVAQTIQPHATLLSCEVEYKPTPADQLDVEDLHGESPSVFAEYEVGKEEDLLRALGRIASINIIGPMHTSKPGIRCVQVTQEGVDKFSGTKIMLAHEGLEGAPILVIGDNTNDIPLIAAAPEGSTIVLMGDAPADMHALANRPLVGKAGQEGWTHAVRRYALEPRIYGVDDQKLRPAMPPEVRDWILARLASDEKSGGSLADPAVMNELMVEFESPDPVDPWAVVNKLKRALGDADFLFRGDLDIFRPLRGDEHAGTVMSGMEEIIPLFRDDPPEVRVIARNSAWAGDDGKVLTVARSGQNFDQATDNRNVTRNLLRATRLESYTQLANELLAGQDIIGGILQGREGAEVALADLRQKWPKELAEYFDDLLLAAYLSDASAHSAYRETFYYRTGRFERAVRQDDAQLTFLFERHASGVLTLKPDCATVVAKHLPGLRRLRHLVTPAN